MPTASASSPPRSLRRSLFEPEAVVIVGASDDSTKLSGRVVSHLRFHGYAGAVHLVNSRRASVQGQPAHARVADVPAGADVAIVAVPAPAVAQAVRDCAAVGIGTAIVFASGFAESSEAGGTERQRELDAVRAETGIRILGPNCIGTIGLRTGFTGSFSALLGKRSFRPGPIAFATQSGAFGTLIFDTAQAEGIGFSHFVNTGNELDITAQEAALELLGDDEVRAVLLYMEGISDGPRLLDVARAADALDKPVVTVKVGRTEAGARAASSHTASLAGEDAVFDGIAERFGLLRVDGMEPLLDAARVLANGRRARGRRLTIVTVSGGAGVLMADAAGHHGLEVPRWSDDWQRRLDGIVPAYGATANPMDLTATLSAKPEMLIPTLDIVAEHPDTDLIAVMLGSDDFSRDALFEAVKTACARTAKPIVIVWAGSDSRPVSWLTDLAIPAFRDPVRAIAALGLLVRWSLRPALPSAEPAPAPRPAAVLAPELITAARSAGRATLDEHESTRLLEAAGIPCAAARAVAGPEEAAEAAAALGYPVCVKVLTADLAHKSELGAVKLGLANAEAVRRATEEVLAIALAHGLAGARALVQRMAGPGVELILGVKRDPAFGPVVAVGIGGIFAEVLSDVSLGPAPLSRSDAAAMLGRLRGAALLDGVRGRPPADRRAVEDALVALSRLAVELGDDVAEIDVNPFIVHAEGATAVDGLVVLR